MTFVIKHRRLDHRPMVAEYHCPAHGRAALEVTRDDQGDPPSSAPCPSCGASSPHVISATRGARVRKVEAVRGGWQKPERKTWLDTRELGEGQELEEFRDKRAAIRDEERRASLKELIDG